MEILFESETEYTYEIYREFCNKVTARPRIIASFVMAVVMALFSLFSWKFFDKPYFLVFLAVAALYPFTIFATWKKTIKKSWESYKLGQGLVSHYRFYSDHVEQENQLGTSSYEYAKLFRVIEGKDAFYLMLADNQGIIVEKSKSSDELCAFLQTLITKKQA